MTHPRGHWWWPSRVTNVKNSVQPVQPSLDLEANRHEAIFLFHSSSTTVSTSTAERSYRIRSSYTSKCPVRPVFPCPNLSLRSRCASSRGQFRTVSPLSRFLPSIVLNRDREFPRSGFRSHRMAKNQRRKKKKINKSRATLVLSMVIPKKDDAGQRCGHCPFGRVPFSHTSSTGWIFCLLYGRNWLSSLPPIIPLRALLSRNRISMDGQRPEPEGLDLRNFLKSDSGDAVGTCELGTELERVGKRFQSLTEDEGLGR